MDFIFAKVTNSRLMGSMGLIIGWEDNDDIVYQYFLIDAEGLGIADYVSLRNASYEELNLSLIHISEPTRPRLVSRMPSSA